MLTTILHVQVVQPFNINVTLMFLKICCNGSNHSVHLTYSLSIFSFIGIISRILQQNIPKSSYFLPCDTYTALKLSKYGVISGPYFPVFGLNTERYSVFSPNTGKYGPEITPYLDNFHAVVQVGTGLKVCYYKEVCYL